jgi:hypothetical protein
MRGIAIDFVKEGAVLSVTRQVTDFDTIVQNSLVNCGTVAGSDPLYSGRGTELYSGSDLIGRVTTYEDAYHASNFAALDTLNFMRASDYDDDEHEKIQSVALEPIKYEGAQLNLNAVVTGSNGTRRGISIFN